MKEEVDAAAAFLSRIFLAHDNITKEKVQEFTSQLSGVLQERFRDHWHESCPTKGQAYRCIRICPEEPLDPLLEKVCNQVGINVDDFNLPMELTLWVDPKEVVCKFGDLKCSYHTVAKKDILSGVLDNQTEQLDIKDLVENARDLYQKKQTVVIHPINPSEMHIQSPYADGSPNGFTMAVRINGNNLSCSPPTSSFDGSPRSKGKLAHSSHHKRGGFHYYGKATGGKGGFMANGQASSTHHTNGNGNGGGFHRNHHHHHHHHHPHGPPVSAYQNGYLNSYQEENGFTSYDQRSVSPSKMNGGGNGLPPLTSLSQGSPTPEQIQQQMQHPPPIPPPMPPHLHQPFTHPPIDPSSLPSHTPTSSQQHLPASSAIIASSTTASSSISSSSSTNNSNNPGKMSNPNQSSGSKFQNSRMGGGRGSNGRQSSPVKEIK